MTSPARPLPSRGERIPLRARDVHDKQMGMRVGEEKAWELRSSAELDCRADALRALHDDGVSCLVGGAYAFFEYTGIFRDTKDIDVFLCRRELERAFASLERAGFRTELLDPVWLGKGFRDEFFVDVIFSSGNGLAIVDDLWFAHARRGEVMGLPVLLAPAEEIIWSKAFVCERDRFDGHDIAHMVRACGERLDWRRLLARFDAHWEVLLSHLVLYRFAFPSERTKVPDWVMRELLRRTWEGMAQGDWERRVCRGPLVSKTQYLHVLKHLGFEDARRLEEEEVVEPVEGAVDGPFVSSGGGG
jgi:hypothetical protein